MESVIPHPPPGPRPDYLPDTRPGTRYVRRGSLPPLTSKQAASTGISKRAHSSAAFERVRPPTPSCVGSNNAARHTAKSRARAAFLEGERAKFDEMFPPLTKPAAAPRSDEKRSGPKEQVASASGCAARRQPGKSSDSGDAAPSVVGAAKLRTLSYSEVARGFSGKTDTLPPATQQQECPNKETTLEPCSEPGPQGEVPRQRSYSEVVQQGPAIVTPPICTNSPQPPCCVPSVPPCALVQHWLATSPTESCCPVPPQHQLCTSQTAQQDHTHKEKDAACCDPATVQHQLCTSHIAQQDQEKDIAYCDPVTVQRPCCPVVVPNHHPCPGTVPNPPCPGTVHPRCPPTKPNRKNYPSEDFETLLARRKEEYARMRAEKERFAQVLEEVRRLVTENETFIARHEEQAAKIKLRKNVDTEEVLEARRRGEQKKEFDLLQAHLRDLFYNKSLIVSQINSEQREKEIAKKKQREEIERLNDNDEVIVEQTMEIVRDMLNKASPSDEDDDNDKEEEEETEDESSSDEEDDESEENSSDGGSDFDYDDDEDDEESVVDATTCKHDSSCPVDCTNAEPDNDQGPTPDQPPDNPSLHPQQELLHELDDLAGKMEEDVLEDLAKLGRLMQLETAHNGKDNCKMLGMVTNLLELIETEHEAKQNNKEETSTEESSCEQEKEVVVVQCKPTEAGAQMSNENKLPAPGVMEENKAEAKTTADVTDTEADEDEDTGPILPAFTSTSINLSSATSKPGIEALASIPCGEEDFDYDEPIFEPESTAACVKKAAKLSELETEQATLPESAGEADQPRSPKSASRMRGEKTEREDSRGGKKQVSFVDEEEDRRCAYKKQPHQQKSTTLYARMSADEVANLVSSALASDITSYVDPNKDACCTQDDCCDPCNTSAQSVVAVKYISVVTTEKDKTKLRRAFSVGGSETEKVLSFTIKGELLLSTPATEDFEREEQGSVCRGLGVQACNIGDDCHQCTNPQGSEGNTLANTNSGTSGEDTSEGVPLNEQVDTTPTDFAHKSKPNGGLVGASSSGGTAEQSNGEKGSNENTPTGREVKQDVTTTPTAVQTCSGGKTPCGVGSCMADCGTEGATQKAETATWPAQNDGESRVTFDADKTRAIVKSNGLRLEFDIVAMCSAICKAVQQQLGPQLTIKTTSPLSLEQAIVAETKSDGVDDKTSLESQEDSAESETATKAVKDTPKENPPAPYVYRMITPSTLGIPPDLLEQMMRRPYDVRCEDPNWVPPPSDTQQLQQEENTESKAYDTQQPQPEEDMDSKAGDSASDTQLPQPEENTESKAGDPTSDTQQPQLEEGTVSKASDTQPPQPEEGTVSKAGDPTSDTQQPQPEEGTVSKASDTQPPQPDIQQPQSEEDMVSKTSDTQPPQPEEDMESKAGDPTSDTQQPQQEEGGDSTSDTQQPQPEEPTANMAGDSTSDTQLPQPEEETEIRAVELAESVTADTPAAETTQPGEASPIIAEGAEQDNGENTHSTGRETADLNTNSTDTRSANSADGKINLADAENGKTDVEDTDLADGENANSTEVENTNSKADIAEGDNANSADSENTDSADDENTDSADGENAGGKTTDSAEESADMATDNTPLGDPAGPGEQAANDRETPPVDETGPEHAPLVSEGYSGTAVKDEAHGKTATVSATSPADELSSQSAVDPAEIPQNMASPPAVDGEIGPHGAAEQKVADGETLDIIPDTSETESEVHIELERRTTATDQTSDITPNSPETERHGDIEADGQTKATDQTSDITPDSPETERHRDIQADGPTTATDHTSDITPDSPEIERGGDTEPEGPAAVSDQTTNQANIATEMVPGPVGDPAEKDEQSTGSGRGKEMDLETDATLTTNTADDVGLNTVPQQEAQQDYNTRATTKSETVNIGCGSFQRDTSSGGEDAKFFSKIRKSLASFRRSDIEEAASAPDNRRADEKLKLRQTRSRPISMPLEPPREPLLPRRAKMNPRFYTTPTRPKSSRAEPLKANSRIVMHADSHQSAASVKKEVVVEEAGSGVKSSKSFRSQSSLVSTDVYTRPKSPRYSHGGRQDERPLTPVASRREDKRSTLPEVFPEPVVSEQLHKPRSLPASLHDHHRQQQQGEAVRERCSHRMRKSRSERVSTVPKLPKL